MLDSLQRTIDCLRVSVTDRCNLRCSYCMPPGGISLSPRSEILRLEEITALVKAAANAGITRVRLTGGEPLVRKGLAYLVESLRTIPRIADLALTTNAVELSSQARRLKEAGLDRVNISLDTLRPERYRELTGGSLHQPLEGIQAALDAGLHPVKINAVVLGDLNLDEAADLAGLSREQPLHIRFIELMPLGGNGPGAKRRSVPNREVQHIIESSLGGLQPAEGPAGSGPARYYRLPGGRGTVGFISPFSRHFCRECNRLRLTADGKLRPCLHHPGEIDLKGPLRQGAGPDELVRLFQSAAAGKPPGHSLDQGGTPPENGGRTMSQIGG